MARHYVRFTRHPLAEQRARERGAGRDWKKWILDDLLRGTNTLHVSPGPPSGGPDSKIVLHGLSARVEAVASEHRRDTLFITGVFAADKAEPHCERFHDVALLPLHDAWKDEPLDAVTSLFASSEAPQTTAGRGRRSNASATLPVQPLIAAEQATAPLASRDDSIPLSPRLRIHRNRPGDGLGWSLTSGRKGTRDGRKNGRAPVGGMRESTGGLVPGATPLRGASARASARRCAPLGATESR